MRLYLNSFIIILLLFSGALEAQTDVKVRKKDFKVDKSGFKQAWQHVKDGDSYYAEKGIWYGNAYTEYLQALTYNNINPELNYKAGVSALYSDNKEDAAEFLLNAHMLYSDVAGDILILTGISLQYSGRYSEAIEKFNDYLKVVKKKDKKNISQVTKYIEECKSALIITRDTLRISINNIGATINSNTDDYSELFSANGNTMYFASRRKQVNSNSSYTDSKYDENIFESKFINGAWGFPVSAGKNITTKYCESPLYISPAYDVLYIYSGTENGGDIMMSEAQRGAWKKPKSIPFRINSSGAETSLAFSPSGNEIYFVSDNKKKSLGGKDIFYIKRLNQRKWSKPENAGPIINSPYDEESVRFSNSGDTLWFSSEGHNSIGGFDIFYCVKNQVGAWDSTRNYGYPVNTPWDELYYHPSVVDDSAFYFVSNRGGGIGGLDIYRGRILPPEHIAPPPVKPDTVIIRDTIVLVKEVAPIVIPEPVKEQGLYLLGKIFDSETGEPVMSKIDIIDIGTDTVIASTISSEINGSYRVKLPEKKSYMIDLRAAGFLPDIKTITIQNSYSADVYSLDISMVKVKVGKKVVLNNILFETGKSILTSGSYIELNRLFTILLDNPQMKIEISGHTDSTGSPAINLKLSESRAKSVVEYLVQMGINRTRLEFKGYGSLEPIADNKTAEGRAENRRVEFKILEF